MINRNKITASHSTLTETAKEIVRVALSLEKVSKISIGIIKRTRTGGGRKDIKFLKVTGGIKAKIRGSGSVQEVIFYTSSPKEVANILSKEIFS